MGGVLISGQALAEQSGVARSNGDIVVTGERLTPQERRQRATAYVRASGVAPGDRAVARWVDPVCPRILGLDPKLARFVEERVRTIVKEAGATLADERCDANVVVSFVGDAGAIIRGIAAREPRRLSEVRREIRPELLNSDAPVRWWYTTEVRGKDGDRLLDSEPAFVTGGGGSPGQVLPGPGKFLSLHNNSIVSTQTARALRSATVLVDANRAAGVKLDALADYVAFVSLVELQPNAKPQPSSVLGLFSASNPPQRLTDWDSRFLRELYRMPLDRRGRQHRGRLTAALLGEAKSPVGEPRQ